MAAEMDDAAADLIEQMLHKAASIIEDAGASIFVNETAAPKTRF
ncbi:hypothetical protein ACU5AX_13225 [Sphingomonas sp. XXL09]